MKAQFVFLLMVLKCSGLFGQVKPSPSYLATDSAVRHGTLPNGFHYYIFKDAKNERSIKFEFIVKAGSIDENENQHGLAHLVEHLGMRSTVNFPDGLKDYFVKKGLTFGGDLIATTGFETSYKLSIPASDTLLRKKAFLAVQDWASGILFVNNEVDQERSAVIRELSMALDPFFNRVKFLQSNENPLYEGHQQRDIENVRAASVNSIIGFYKDWYHPVNQALVITGNLNEDEMESRIKEYFTDLSNNGTKKRNLSIIKEYDIALSGKNRLIVAEFDSKDRREINVQIFKMKKSITQVAFNPITKNDFRNQIVYKLGEMLMAKRLKSVDSNAILGGLNIDLDAIFPAAGINAITAYGDVKSIHSVADVKSFIQFVATEMRRIELFGFSASEFELEKKIFLMSIKHPNSSIFPSLSLATHYIDASAFISPSDQLSLRAELLSTISLQEINQALTSWISSNGNIDVVVTGPSTDILALPTEQEIFLWISQIFESNLSPYRDNQTKQLALLTSPIRDISYTRTEIRALKVTKLVLKNGTTVLFRPVTSVEGKMSIRGINSRADGKEWLKNMHSNISELLENAKSLFGVGVLSPKEISTWEKNLSFDSELLFVKPILNSERSEIFGQASIGNLEPMLRLIYGYFMESKINLAALNDFQKQIKENDLHRGHDILGDTISSLINGSSDRLLNASKTTQVIDKTFIENLFYKQFSNAGEFTFIITGSFDIDSILPLVVNYLGSLKGKPVNQAAKKIVLRRKMGKPVDLKLREVSLIGDSVGNLKVRLLFPGFLDPTIKNRLLIEITGDIISSLLFSRLREKEKGIYSVLVNPKVTNDPQRFFWDIDFECSPADVDKLVLATQDELKQLSKGIINAAVFSNARGQVRAKIMRDLNNPYYWGSYLSDQVRKETLSLEAITRLDVLDTITASDITNSIRDHVNLDKYLLFKLL